MIYPKPGANVSYYLSSISLNIISSSIFQVQRIQFKLLSQTDFETIVNIFQDLGFQTKESSTPVPGPSIPPRTSTSSAPPPSMYSATSGSSSVSSSSASSVARPASAMRSSPLSREISFGNTPTFKLPPIPEVAKSDVHRQDSNMPFSNPYNPALSALSTSMVSRVDSVKYGQDLNKHSSLYFSQMDSEV